MLGQRRRRWPSIDPLGLMPLFADLPMVLSVNTFHEAMRAASVKIMDKLAIRSSMRLIGDVNNRGRTSGPSQ